MEKKIDTTQILAFHQFLREDEREQSTIQKYLRDVKIFCEVAGGAAGKQGGGFPVEGAPAKGRLPADDSERKTFRPQQVFFFSELE